MTLTKLTKGRARWQTFKLKLAKAVSRNLYDKIVEQGVTPEDFGAKPNDPNFDCLPAITAAIETGHLKLLRGQNYYVSDEVVLKSGLFLNCETDCKITAMTGQEHNWTKKAVVRCSYHPIGITPNVSTYTEQIVNLNQVGKLIIEANRVADFGFYARALTNNSELDYIMANEAKVCGVCILMSWYCAVKGSLAGLRSTHNVCLGYPLAGETGDIFCNAFNVPSLNSWGYLDKSNNDYDPTGAVELTRSGAGVILGKGLGNTIGTLTSEATMGAGLWHQDAVSWNVNSLYLEGNAKSPNGQGVAWCTSPNTGENSAFMVGNLHLSGGLKILTRLQSDMLDIGSIYRFDKVQTFHANCPNNTIKVGNMNYYGKLAYNYAIPDCVVKDAPAIVAQISGIDASKWNTYYFGVTKLTKGKIVVTLDKELSTPATFILEGEGGNDIFNVSSVLHGFGLAHVHNTNRKYKLSMATVAQEACNATLTIYDEQYFW